MAKCPGPSSQRVRTTAWTVLSALAVMVVACGDDNGNDEHDRDAGDGNDGEEIRDDSNGDSTASDDIVGNFTIKLVPPVSGGAAGHTQVVGKVYDGVTPQPVSWEETTSQAGCRLLEPRVSFCDKPCGGGAICVGENTCATYPTARAVGNVTIQGVRTTDGATEFTMKPIVNGYQPAEDLPFPAFAEGDAIQLEGRDADKSAFKIKAKGVAPLELAEAKWRIERDKPLTIEWTPPGPKSDARMLVRLDISHHGGSKGKIECDVDDNGKLEIPADMIAMLLDLGVSGFPTVIMTRESIGTVKISYGVVALRIDAVVEAEVVVPGVTSCTASSDCPSGKTCQDDLQCK